MNQWVYWAMGEGRFQERKYLKGNCTGRSLSSMWQMTLESTFLEFCAQYAGSSTGQSPLPQQLLTAHITLGKDLEHGNLPSLISFLRAILLPAEDVVIPRQLQQKNGSETWRRMSEGRGTKWLLQSLLCHLGCVSLPLGSVFPFLQFIHKLSAPSPGLWFIWLWFIMLLTLFLILQWLHFKNATLID